MGNPEPSPKVSYQNEQMRNTDAVQRVDGGRSRSPYYKDRMA